MKLISLQNNKYYLLKPIESIDEISTKAPVVFQPLDVKTDAQFVPKKWSVSGDIPLNEVLHNNSIWFPSDIDEAVVLKNVELYLFHSNSIRWTIITDNWPQGMQCIHFALNSIKHFLFSKVRNMSSHLWVPSKISIKSMQFFV